MFKGEIIMKKEQENLQSKILTIPNTLSFLRLCLIPIFVWLYCVKEDYVATIVVLLISGFTDVLDGFIARHFNMISNLGKALDPVADKLTQGAMLFCLLTNFSFMWIPLILLIIKEVFTGITGLLIIKKTGNVYGAEWHGKLTTCMIYAMIMVHLIWYDISVGVSAWLIVSCVIVMVMSCVLYGKRNYQLLKSKK